jgi:hypothetical protein
VSSVSSHSSCFHFFGSIGPSITLANRARGRAISSGDVAKLAEESVAEGFGGPTVTKPAVGNKVNHLGAAVYDHCDVDPLAGDEQAWLTPGRQHRWLYLGSPPPAGHH